MTKIQFHVLFREFLFRMVDRELLSAQAQGDSNRLLGRFAAILIWVSVGFAALAGGNSRLPRSEMLVSAWPGEHMVIATTMLVIGLFAVLSWDSTFPDRRDVLILSPLPVKAATIFLAKASALGAALSLTVVTFNALPGLALPFALTPPGSNFLDMLFSLELYRGFAAYWITVLAAGAFVLFCVLCAQGIAAQLPRSAFLRLSSVLQIGTFCVCMCVYFLQPSLTRIGALTSEANRPLLDYLPSYWFLALFQQLNGSIPEAAHPTLTRLAVRAWLGLALAGLGSVAAFALSYFRTLRKIVEEPDITPAARRSLRLPRFGDFPTTALVHFTIRTLLRSRQHRVILSFYCGMGFAILILFLKTPVAQKLAAASSADPWRQVSLPVIASTFVILCFWLLGIRMAFAMPIELRANWMFRTIAIRAPAETLSMNRTALYITGLLPLSLGSAAVLAWLWPWSPAAGHLLVIAALGVIGIELALHGFHKIPFTCSYLPGKSNLHMTVCLCLLLGLNAMYLGAEFERRALMNPSKFWWMIAGLVIVAFIARRRTEIRAARELELRFEEQEAPVIASLGLHRDGYLPVQRPGL